MLLLLLPDHMSVINLYTNRRAVGAALAPGGGAESFQNRQLFQLHDGANSLHPRGDFSRNMSNTKH